jgi:hypothetical protein
VQDTTASSWYRSTTSGLQLASCDASTASQRSLPPPLTTPLFYSQSKFTVCLSAAPGQCVSDGGAATSTASGAKLKMVAKTAPAYKGANMFVYERRTARIKSAADAVHRGRRHRGVDAHELQHDHEEPAVRVQQLHEAACAVRRARQVL